jgi:hypothetical protein
MKNQHGRKPSRQGARRKKPDARKQVAQKGRRRNIDRRISKGIMRSLPGGARFKGDLCNARGALDDGTEWECDQRRAYNGLCAKHALEALNVTTWRDGEEPPAPVRYTPPLRITPKSQRPHKKRKKVPGIYYPWGDGTAWVRVTDPRKNRPDRWALIDAIDIPVVGEWEVYYHEGQRFRRRRWDWVVTGDTNGRTWWVIDRDTKTPMHRVLIGRAPDGMSIDHINRHGWDNRRANLRHATFEEQAANRTKPSDPKPPPPPRCAGCNFIAQVVFGLRRGNKSRCPACLLAERHHRQGDRQHPEPRPRGER